MSITVKRCRSFITNLTLVGLIQLSLTHGEAATVSVNGSTFDISIFSGSYDANLSLFNVTALIS